MHFSLPPITQAQRVRAGRDLYRADLGFALAKLRALREDGMLTGHDYVMERIAVRHGFERAACDYAWAIRPGRAFMAWVTGR